MPYLRCHLFILTGDLINKSGIAKRLSDFAYSCLGWIRGGLAMAAIGACGLFAAISGSNSATTATIGSMLHPEMVKGGYDERFSAATAAAGGTVGIIIPPSIIFIVYGFLMNLPISDLFIAGIVPGALMVLAMMATCFIVCSINGWGIIIASVLQARLENGCWRMAWLLRNRSGSLGDLHRQVLADRGGWRDRWLWYHRGPCQLSP